MSVRSLNKVILIGNLTRDPELRYTPAGTAVCTFGLATNRQWTTQTGETKEETEFHRIVSWNKLAELCTQLLSKGRKVYVEGRLATHSWTGQDGAQRTTTEIVIDDMIILDSRKVYKEESEMSFPSRQTAPIKAEETQAADIQTTDEITGADNLEPVKEEVSVNTEEKGKKHKKTEEKNESKEETKEEIREKRVEKTEDITPDDIPF